VARKRGGQPGNQNALTHGGERAIKALQRGDDLKGDALAIYHHELNTLGLDLDVLGDIGLMLAMDYARESAVSQLFYRALFRAYDDGDDDGLFRCGGRFVWLSGRASRALDRLFKHVGHW
jgi:hypothetical protein